jgi:hypothetical protein
MLGVPQHGLALAKALLEGKKPAAVATAASKKKLCRAAGGAWSLRRVRIQFSSLGSTGGGDVIHAAAAWNAAASTVRNSSLISKVPHLSA